MAERTTADIARIFQLLGLPVPDQGRLQRLRDDPRSVTQIRNSLLWSIANSDPDDDVFTAEDALKQVIDRAFAAAGIEDAGTGGETEAQRLQRIAQDILSGGRTLGEVSQTIAGFGDGGAGGGGNVVNVGSSTIPSGGRLIRVNNPEGSDEPFLYFVAYQWRGVEFVYEVGGPARFRELFGSTDNFDAFTTVSQARFDDENFVEVGSIDQELGATESLGSRIERETRALGLEDIPEWLSSSPDALALIGQATAQEWSSGRLWKELSTQQTFKNRWGGVLDRYLQEGLTIGQAVNRIAADEDALRAAIRPFFAGEEAGTTDFLQGLLNSGWTAGAVAQVLESAEILRRDPESLARSNFILEAHGLDTLDEVGFINALHGVGPQDTVEALNTATAARALDEAGIDLDGDDVRLIMELVDTSDRLLTVEAWRELAQQLSFNAIRFHTEIAQSKLDITEEDLFAVAFGRESPTGRSVGQNMALLARFERDRRAAGEGIPGATGFVDQRGRFRFQGLSRL